MHGSTFLSGNKLDSYLKNNENRSQKKRIRCAGVSVLVFAMVTLTGTKDMESWCEMAGNSGCFGITPKR
jgi:hypothetical protein